MQIRAIPVRTICISERSGKDAIENVRGNETSNSAKHTETMDIDAFPVLSNGLQSIGGGGMSHPVKMIDAIDNIGNAIDAGYEANEQVNNIRETNKKEANSTRSTTAGGMIFLIKDDKNPSRNLQVRDDKQK